MANTQSKYSSYLYILITLYLSALVLSILSNVFHFIDVTGYKHIIFGFSVYNVVALLLLVIAETISLKFDRTASKLTAFATYSLFISYLFSNDIILGLSLLGLELPTSILKITSIFHLLFLLGFCYFILVFFENSYHTKRYYLTHLVCFGLLFLASIPFIIFDLSYVLLGIYISIIVYVIYFIFIYQKEFQKKENNIPAYISTMLLLMTMSSLPFSLIYNGVNSFLGSESFFLVGVTIGYILIYTHFIINRTKISYSLEDHIKEEERIKSHKMKVTCFHAFDCYYNDKHLVFPSKKAKEYFALLVVLNGRSLTLDKAITYLWPDKDIDKAKTLYRNTIMKLRNYFKEIGFDNVTFKRGEVYIATSNIDCDYYDVINKKDKYDGSPLLPEYEWSLEFENFLTH